MSLGCQSYPVVQNPAGFLSLFLVLPGVQKSSFWIPSRTQAPIARDSLEGCRLTLCSNLLSHLHLFFPKGFYQEQNVGNDFQVRAGHGGSRVRAQRSGRLSRGEQKVLTHPGKLSENLT